MRQQRGAIFRASQDEIIDVIEGSRVYIPCIYVLNKIDQVSMEELRLLCRYPHFVPISARDNWNLDELLETMWEYCQMIRIYPKPKGEVPDFEDPVILRTRHPRVEDFCNRIHRGIMAQFKQCVIFARLLCHWGGRVSTVTSVVVLLRSIRTSWQRLGLGRLSEAPAPKSWKRSRFVRRRCGASREELRSVPRRSTSEAQLCQCA